LPAGLTAALTAPTSLSAASTVAALRSATAPLAAPTLTGLDHLHDVLAGSDISKLERPICLDAGVPDRQYGRAGTLTDRQKRPTS
jgi:hypothetical protein